MSASRMSNSRMSASRMSNKNRTNRTKIANMYNNNSEVKEQYGHIKFLYNSGRQHGFSVSKKNTDIYRKRITNRKVSLCKKLCQPGIEDGKIGSCVVTNTTIGLKDCTHPDGKTRYHYIRPTELAVDTLQYAFDTGRVSIVEDKTGSYLTFEDFPTLQVETVMKEKDVTTTYKDTRRNEGFYYAYEDADTLAEFDYGAQLAEYQATGTYKTALKYRELETEDIPENYTSGFSTQDIQYVKDIASSLENAYTFTNTDGILKAELTKPDELKCDLAGMDPKYIIVEPMILEGVDGSSTTEEYVICGYPDRSKMGTYLKMMEDPVIKERIDKIHDQHRKEFARLFAEMHNSVSEEKDKIIDFNNELHKFMKSNNISYFEKWIMQNEQLDKDKSDSWVNTSDFQGKIKFMKANGLVNEAEYIENEVARTCLSTEERNQQIKNIKIVKSEFNNYVNKLLNEYLNKPMTRIRYHFIIYRKQMDNHLIPALFNIKQLDTKHKPLLEKVLELIQIKIPNVFNILIESIHKLSHYKLFHSYVKYGDFFYISTEYLHTMSNFTHYAYKFENNLLLEELIYSLSNVTNFWQRLKIEYQLKKFRIAMIESKIILINNNNNTAKISNYNKLSKKSNYNKLSKKSNLLNKKNILLKGIILMIFEKSYQEYVIVYKTKLDSDQSIFRFLELKSNLAKCNNEIINNIFEIQNIKNIFNCKNVSFGNIKYRGKLFKVVNNNILGTEVLKIIKQYNPLILKNIENPNTENRYISIKEMIKTELLDYETENDTQVVNVNYFYPIIYFNLIMNQNYIDALIYYNKTNDSGISKEIKNLSLVNTVSYQVYNEINSIINPNNCNYDIIEKYYFGRNILWIIPHDKTSKNTYLRKFTSLNKSHLPLLEAIKNYCLKNKDDISFLHIQSTNVYGLLHFHIVSHNSYEARTFPEQQRGNKMIQEININNIINKLLVNETYYNNYNVSFIKTTI